MNEIELIDYVKSNIKTILKPISIVQIEFVQIAYDEYNFELDLIAEVTINNKKKVRLLFVTKSEGQPRYARRVSIQLKNLINQNKNCYGVFAAPYISDESKQICKDNNVGFIDLAGNYLFAFDTVYLNREGKPNPYPRNRSVKTIFSPKSTRILRVLLCNPKKEWYVRDLAKEADISIGQTSNVKQKLLDFEYVEEKLVGRKLKLVLTKPELLLQKWSENYNLTRNQSRNF
ncbi:MAG: hypothetical protein KAH01_05580, partial [Caldisericia bacterium]|nr:hypothetical protein [Caldisericia bacterium]